MLIKILKTRKYIKSTTKKEELEFESQNTYNKQTLFWQIFIL